MNAFATILTLLAQVLPTPSYLPNVKLKSPCSLSVEMINREENGLFVSCERSRFRVYHPKSMYGLVALQHEAEALQFVRLFSSRYTASMAGLGGAVEVRPLDEQAGIDFYYVPVKIFVQRFQRAAVSSYDGGVDGKIFLVQRLVIRSDQHVYWVKERISRNGNYDLVDEVLVERDASKLGIKYSYLH
jgi:hypothetical protein